MLSIVISALIFALIINLILVVLSSRRHQQRQRDLQELQQRVGDAIPPSSIDFPLRDQLRCGDF